MGRDCSSDRIYGSVGCIWRRHRRRRNLDCSPTRTVSCQMVEWFGRLIARQKTRGNARKNRLLRGRWSWRPLSRQYLLVRIGGMCASQHKSSSRPGWRKRVQGIGARVERWAFVCAGGGRRFCALIPQPGLAMPDTLGLCAPAHGNRRMRGAQLGQRSSSSGRIVTEPDFEAHEKDEMKTLAYKPLHLRLPAGGVAAILLSGVAIILLSYSAQSFVGDSVAAQSPEAVTAAAIAAPATRGFRCDECGVIESTRKIEAPSENAGIDVPARITGEKRGAIKAKPLGNYEITIRMQDGSMRVIKDAKSAQWRHGERVIIIAGAD